MYLGKPDKIETWRFPLVEGDWTNINKGEVLITFQDGIFQCCHYPFSGLYTREQWDLIHQICHKIEEIEKKYEEN